MYAVCAYMCIRIYAVYIYIYIHIHIHTYTRLYTYVYIHIYIYRTVYVYHVYVYVSVCIYIYTDTHCNSLELLQLVCTVAQLRPEELVGRRPRGRAVESEEADPFLGV